MASFVAILFATPTEFNLGGTLRVSTLPLKVAAGLGFVAFTVSLILLGIANIKGISKKAEKFCEKWFNECYKLVFVLMGGTVVLALTVAAADRGATYILARSHNTLMSGIFWALFVGVIYLFNFLQKKLSGVDKD